MPTIIKTPIPAPVVRPRTVSTALSTYIPLDDGVFSDSPEVKRWLNGVSFCSAGCAALLGETIEDPCADGSITALEDNVDLADDDAVVSFDAFVVDARVTAPVTSGPPESQIRALLQMRSALARSVVVAREALTGGLTTNSPSFVSEADTVVGVDGTPVGALAAVEDGLADKLQGGVGMIHVTPGMLTILNSGGGLVFDGEDYRTATGHLVVADAGYTGGAPSTGAVTSGENWIYGSGPVFLKLGDTRSFETLDWRHNVAVHRMQQYALLVFEPCAVVAAKAT